jgi:SAM-dependent methyltransferase
MLSRIREVYRSIKQLPEIAEAVQRMDALLRDCSLSPVDRYILSSGRDKSGGLFHPSYDAWRSTRLDKLLSVYGVDYFDGKDVLELGGGHGEIGAFMADLGANVLCLDGRAQNVNYARLKHRRIHSFRCMQADLEEDFSDFGHFDLIVDFGLLYHLRNVDQHLQCCFAMTDDIFLETVVCDSADPFAILYCEEDSGMDEESLRGTGSRPSPAYVERLAAENGFAVHRYFDADLNVGDQFVYDWEQLNDGRDGEWRLRRLWRFTRPRAADVGGPPSELSAPPP